MTLIKSGMAALDEALGALFAEGRKPHAILIDGGDEADRAAAADYTASLFVCSSDQKPCGRCENCRKARGGFHPDLVSVTRPADKKFFVKSDVKAVTADAFLTPNEAETKVFILRELQFMTEECQNVLLKILEEPPAFSAFILTAETGNAVIQTVQSRVVKIHLSETENVSQEDPQAMETAGKIIDALFSPYEFDLVAASSPLDGNKALTGKVLPLLTLFFRDALVQKDGGEPLLKEFSQSSSKAAAMFGGAELLHFYDSMASLTSTLVNYPNYTLLSALIPVRLKERTVGR